MLAELRRSNEEYFLVTVSLLIEFNDPRIPSLDIVNSFCPLPAIKLCSRMPPGDYLFLSQTTVTNAGRRNNSKSG